MAGGYGVGLFDSKGPSDFAAAIGKISDALSGVQGSFGNFGTSATSALGNISSAISDLTTKLSSLQTQLSGITSTISAGVGGGGGGMGGGGAAPTPPASGVGGAGGNLTSFGSSWTTAGSGIIVPGSGFTDQGPSSGQGPGMQPGSAAKVNPPSQGQPQPQDTAKPQPQQTQATSPFQTGLAQGVGAMIPATAGAAAKALTGGLGSMISTSIQGATIGQMMGPAFGVNPRSLYVVPKGQMVQNAADYAQGNYYAMTQMGVAPGTSNWSTIQQGANQFMAMVPGMSYQGAMAAQNQMQQPGVLNAALGVGLNLRPGGQLLKPEQQFSQIYQRLTMGGKVSAQTFESMMQPGAPGAANLQAIGITPGSDAYNAFIQYGLSASGGKSVPDLSTKAGVKKAGFDTPYYSQLQATSAAAQLTSQAEPGIAEAAKNLNNAATSLLQLAHPLGGIGGGIIGGALGSPSGMLTSGLAMYGGFKMLKGMGGLGGIAGKVTGIGGGGGGLLSKILGLGGKGAAGAAAEGGAAAAGGEAAAAGGLEAAGLAADATGVGLPVGLGLAAAGGLLAFHKPIEHAIGSVVGGIEKHPGVLLGPAGLAAEEFGPKIARGIGHGIQGVGHFLGSVFGGHKKSTTDSGDDSDIAALQNPPKGSVLYLLTNKPEDGSIFAMETAKKAPKGSVLDQILSKPEAGTPLGMQGEHGQHQRGTHNVVLASHTTGTKKTPGQKAAGTAGDPGAEDLMTLLSDKPPTGSVSEFLMNKPPTGSAMAAVMGKAPTTPQHAAPAPAQTKKGGGGTGGHGGGGGGVLGSIFSGVGDALGGGGIAQALGLGGSQSTPGASPYMWAVTGGGAGMADLASLWNTPQKNQSSGGNSGNGGSGSSSSGSSPSAGPTNLTGSGNVQQAYNYFISKGLKDYMSAGIVGNLAQESGVNPKSTSPGAQGIAQWTPPDPLIAWAKSQNRDPTTLATQLDFIWQQMNSTEKGSLSAVQASTDASSAAQAFEQSFERAGIPMMQNRIKYAQNVLSSKGAGYARGTQLIARTQLAVLHRGESVVTAADNYSTAPYNKGGAAGGAPVTLNFKQGSIVLQVPAGSNQADMDNIAKQFVSAISQPQVLAAVRSK